MIGWLRFFGFGLEEFWDEVEFFVVFFLVLVGEVYLRGVVEVLDVGWGRVV